MNSRLFEMLYCLLDKGQVRAQELAERFEVSVRTIYRDMDALSGAGIPIYACRGKNGGLRIAEDFILPGSLLTADERQQLLAALVQWEGLGLSGQGALLSKMSALFRIRQTDWIEVDFSFWQDGDAFSSAFETIKRAILSRNLLAFTYFSSRKEETKRRVKPIRLVFRGQDWYLYAYCLLREDDRYFKLSRMQHLTVLAERFEDDFSGAEPAKQPPPADTVRVRLRFDKSAAFRALDELRASVTEGDDGSLYAEAELPNDVYLYGYLLSFADAAEVLWPEEVRLRMKEIIKNMSARYHI